MISTARFRELLGEWGNDLEAAEIVALREQLYAVAASICDLYRNGVRTSTDEQTILCRLPSDTLAEVEERAAVLEFDANMTRDQATRLALSLSLAPGPKRTKPS